MLTAIAARARNGAIGRDNTIPWFVPEDLAFFKRETLGGALIMGRLTWDSLPFKPLKDRLNIVVSREDLGPCPARSVAQAIEIAQAQGYSRIYAIGGAGIYREALDLADRLLLTEVETEVPDADAFFPAIDDAQWRLATRLPLAGTAPACTVHEYHRLR